MRSRIGLPGGLPPSLVGCSGCGCPREPGLGTTILVEGAPLLLAGFHGTCAEGAPREGAPYGAGDMGILVGSPLPGIFTRCGHDPWRGGGRSVITLPAAAHALDPLARFRAHFIAMLFCILFCTLVNIDIFYIIVSYDRQLYFYISR